MSDAPKPEARRPLSSYTQEELDALYAPTVEEDRAFANASFVAPEARLTDGVEEMKRQILLRTQECVEYHAQIAAQREEIERLTGLVEEVGNSGVEFQDERVNYVSVQVDRDTFAECKALAERRKG
jgi:ribulose 1,5-bisphosphate carboxylase large subunit-like protein